MWLTHLLQVSALAPFWQVLGLDRKADPGTQDSVANRVLVMGQSNST